MEWATRLRRAMEEDRLLLDYQEVVPLAPEPGDHAPRIELLLRLRDEFGNEVAPGAFLPAAERYGLMPAIDRWVIRTALAHADRLHPRGSALCSFAINLSGASIEDQGDRKSTRLNSSHVKISYAVFCLQKKSHERSEV